MARTNGRPHPALTLAPKTLQIPGTVSRTHAGMEGCFCSHLKQCQKQGRPNGLPSPMLL